MRHAFGHASVSSLETDYWTSWLNNANKWPKYEDANGLDLAKHGDGILPGDVSVAAAVETKFHLDGSVGGLSGQEDHGLRYQE